MKKIIVVFSITAALIAAALIIPSIFAAKEKNAVPAVPPAAVAPTATPVAQPTTAPTPSAPIPSAMTAEEFFRGLHAKGISGVRGTEITFTGVIAKKSDKDIYFNVQWDDPTRGELTFVIIVRPENSNDLSTVTVGETVTVTGKMNDIIVYRYAALNQGRIIRN